GATITGRSEPGGETVSGGPGPNAIPVRPPCTSEIAPATGMSGAVGVLGPQALAPRRRLGYTAPSPGTGMGLGVLVGGGDDGVDASPDVEIADHAHLPGLQESDEVVQDTVGHVLVEVPLVAERPEIELQRLQLDAECL